jgi:orotidine-5'-phosphate decarboxylase
MKAGATYNLMVKVPDITDSSMDIIDKIIFTLQTNSGNMVQKVYPEAVTLMQDIFIIPLSQQDTETLEGLVKLEAQINYSNKAVQKSYLKTFTISETLATEKVDDDKPDSVHNLELLLKIIGSDTLVVDINPELAEQLITEINKIYLQMQQLQADITEQVISAQKAISVQQESALNSIVNQKDASLNSISEVANAKIGDINNIATSQINAINATATSQLQAMSQSIDALVNAKIQDIQSIVDAKLSDINNTAAAQITAINNSAVAAIDAANKSISQAAQSQIDGINQVALGKISDINTIAQSQIDAINATATSQLQAMSQSIDALVNAKIQDIQSIVDAKLSDINNTAAAQITAINNSAVAAIDAANKSISQAAQSQIDGINQVALGKISDINTIAQSQIDAINNTAQAQASALDTQAERIMNNLGIKAGNITGVTYTDTEDTDVSQYNYISFGYITYENTYNTLLPAVFISVTLYKVKDNEVIETINSISSNTYYDVSDCDAIRINVSYQGGTGKDISLEYSLSRY